MIGARRGKIRILALVVPVVAAAVVEMSAGDQLRAYVRGVGGFALFVIVAGSALGTAVFFPKPVLAAAAGPPFGVVPGVVLAVVGFTAGALLSFGIARTLGRRAIEARLGLGRLRLLDSVFDSRGVVATLVLRLLPVVPFTAANFAAGVTSVRGRSFALGTAVGAAVLHAARRRAR